MIALLGPGADPAFSIGKARTIVVKRGSRAPGAGRDEAPADFGLFKVIYSANTARRMRLCAELFEWGR
jgi:hypothetical protein